MEASNVKPMFDEFFPDDGSFGDIRRRESICKIHGAYEETGRVYFHGRIVWSGCIGCDDDWKLADEAQRKAEYDAECQKIIEKRLNRSGIPVRFRDRNFANFTPANDDQRHALKIAEEFSRNFDEHFKDGSSLIFSGKAGTGKTHLALAIAQSVMPKHAAMYLNAMDAVRMIRDTWRKGSEQSESEVLDLLGSIDLLVIDEVGVQNGTENEQVLMFDIINRRYRDMKPTIFLTNLGTKGFSDYVTERSFDRLKESGVWVTFDWDSYRGRKG